MSKALVRQTDENKWRAIVPAVASGVLPGLGQLVNGQKDKALGVFAVAAGAYLFSFIPLIGGLGTLALAGTWLYGVADGYFTGKKNSK